MVASSLADQMHGRGASGGNTVYEQQQEEEEEEQEEECLQHINGRRWWRAAWVLVALTDCSREHAHSGMCPSLHYSFLVAHLSSFEPAQRSAPLLQALVPAACRFPQRLGRRLLGVTAGHCCRRHNGRPQPTAHSASASAAAAKLRGNHTQWERTNDVMHD